jgi:hypothetical protein
MKPYKLQQYSHLLSLLVVATALNWSASAFAVPVVGVHRTGPQNIYKGSCGYSTTTFTVTLSAATTNLTEVYIYIGGEGDAFCGNCMSGSQNRCDKQVPGDFNATGSYLSMIEVVPNLFELDIPPGHTSTTVTITALNNPNPCGNPEGPNLLVTLPGTSDYTQNEYIVDTNAQSDTGYIWETAPPPITVNVTPDNFPPNIYKDAQSSMSFTLTASAPFPAREIVTFFVGGDGTADGTGGPCYATYPTDFSVSGASTAPFPNGFFVTFNEGDTSKTFTVTAINSETDCTIAGSQPLIVTIPSPPGCAYSPGSNAQFTAQEIPSY